MRNQFYRRRGTRVHYPDDRNPNDPYASARKMMVTVACGTAKRLGYTWEPQKDGSIHVTMGEHTHIAEDWQTFARWMHEDWQARKI